MKKLLAVILAALICASAFAGCSKTNGDNTDNSVVSDSQNTNNNGTDALAEGDSQNASWAVAEQGFKEAEKVAEKELASGTVSFEDFVNMVIAIDNACIDLEYLSNEEINQKLADAYKAACKLEIIAGKSTSDEGKDLEEMAKSAKEFLKAYYDGSGIDYNTAQEQLKKSGEKLSSLSEEEAEAYYNAVIG